METIKLNNEKTQCQYDNRLEYLPYEFTEDKPLLPTSINKTLFTILDKAETILNNDTIISNVETIICNKNGYYFIYESDRFGFNNPDSEWDKKEIEYLLVGDSFTHGHCVNRPDDIASVLRTLSKKSVLNLYLIPDSLRIFPVVTQ